jgi:hypothetical protein
MDTHKIELVPSAFYVCIHVYVDWERRRKRHVVTNCLESGEPGAACARCAMRARADREFEILMIELSQDEYETILAAVTPTGLTKLFHDVLDRF